MITPDHLLQRGVEGGKELSLTPTPSRRRSMLTTTCTPSSRLTTPTNPNSPLLNPTPESGISSSASITNVKPRSRRSIIRRAHPKTNEPLARIVSATTSSMTTVGRTPEEISASYEQWMKLAADNKINASNSWHLGLIDYFADMGILKHGDGGGINFQKASCTLDGCVKIYSTRVDAVALDTEQLVSGLNDTKQSAALNQSNADDLDDTGLSGPTEKPKRIRRANTKTLEKDFSAINVTSTEAEFMIDPLFRKTCAEFDEGGAHSLLLSRLTVGGQGEIIFDSSDVVTYQSKQSDDLEENIDDAGTSVMNLSMFPSLAKLATIDLSKKTICNSLKNIVLSDDIQGIEALTEVLELELMDDMYNAPAVEGDATPSSQVVNASLDQELNYGHIAETDQDADLQVLDNDQMPEYVPISLNAMSSEDFYSEANVFDDADEYENEIENVEGLQRGIGVDYNQPGAVGLQGSETGVSLSVDDDQFLMVPLPRSHGIFASSVSNGPASNRMAKLRSSSMQGNGPGTATSSKPTRKPLETIQFRDAKAPKIETLFAKGTTSINIPRATTGTNTNTDLVTMHNMHVSTNPFDPSTLSRSCLRPSTTFPRSLARDLKHVGAVPRMIDLLGGVLEEVPVVSDDDDNDCGLIDVGDTGAADWDVEVPVMDDGEEDRTNAGGLSDPVVMDDIARFGNQEQGLDAIQPIMDFSLEPSKLSMDGLDMFGSQPDFGFGNLIGGLSNSNGVIPFRRNRMGLSNILKRSKRVDVKRLKENIWKTIRQEVILAPQRNGKVVVVERDDEESPGGMSFSNMIQLVGQEYSVDQSKDISIPFYFICVLHLANEKDLELDAQGMQELYVKSYDKSS